MKWLVMLLDHLWIWGLLIFGGLAYYGVAKKNRQENQAKKILQKAVATGLDEPLSLHPEVDPAKCAGCGACTKVCPEGDILKMINSKAVLVSPTKCVGHGECERACPFGAIDLVFGTKKRGVDIPRLSKNYETNVPGLYIAGELGGMGLIRNAIKQGHQAADHALSNLNPSVKSDTDVLVVGAGPAGLAVCLTAIVHKKRYLCIEQNTAGGTVYNFPRQKVVMTHPADLPGVGKMKFPRNVVSKEELLHYWNQVRQKVGIKIRENEKFEGLEKVGDHFKVKTSKAEYMAQKVVLAMGVRGSPRRLGLPNEDTTGVAYNLIDPAQYTNKKIAVVGGGNAGVEAAQMLANPKYKNQVTLLVRGPAFDRCNEDNKRIIEDMAQKKMVQIWYEAQVKEIKKDQLNIERAGQLLDIENDQLFVFAGAEMPFKFLMSLGVEINKAFGQKLKSGG
ncbi:MAG: NAD(P)-binding domain-containing protein [Bdellovibrionales bacterium]